MKLQLSLKNKGYQFDYFKVMEACDIGYITIGYYDYSQLYCSLCQDDIGYITIGYYYYSQLYCSLCQIHLK